MKLNIKLPHSTWHFTPATGVKESGKRYSCAKAKRAARRQINE